MDSTDLKRGARIATALATMLVASACADDSEPGTSQGELRCIGGNSCTGMSECSGGPGSSACEGMNECAGMGWVYTETEEECTDLMGTVES